MNDTSQATCEWTDLPRRSKPVPRLAIGSADRAAVAARPAALPIATALDALTPPAGHDAATVSPGPEAWQVRWSDEPSGEPPVLVLAASAGTAARGVRFAGGRTWLTVRHQSAGLACHQRTWVATRLTPRPEVVGGLTALVGAGHCCVGALGAPSLDELVRYRDLVRRHLPADVNVAWLEYEEAVYPLDCTPEIIAALAVDELPDDLDELCEWRSPFDRMLGLVGRWKLLVLGPNCD
jgi:hypothetical protein